MTIRLALVLLLLLSACGDDDDGGMPGDTCFLECATGAATESCTCERTASECTTDADCTIANAKPDCCAACADAYPRSLVRSEPCLGAIDSEACTSSSCADIACGRTCTPARKAVCSDGRCTAVAECEPDEVLENDRCVPGCLESDECVLVRNTSSCCEGCPGAANVMGLADLEESCVVPVGMPAPAGCAPPASQCANVDCTPCAAMPDAATCDDQRRCVANPR